MGDVDHEGSPEEGQVDTLGMTEAQKKLFALRLKINQSRKANKEEVEREYRRLKDPQYESKQRLAESYDQRLKEGKAMTKQEALLHETAVRRYGCCLNSSQIKLGSG